MRQRQNDLAAVDLRRLAVILLFQMGFLSLVSHCLLAEETPTEAYARGSAALAAGAWQEAVEAFTAAQEYWPEHPQILLLSGISAYHAELLLQAEFFLQAAAGVDEAWEARRLYYLGLTQQRLGRSQAAATLQQIVRQYPDSDETARLRAALSDRHETASEEHSWQASASLLLLYDDNPARLEDESGTRRLLPADGLLQTNAAIWRRGAGAAMPYLLQVSSERYREATVVDKLQLDQRLEFFHSRMGRGSLGVALRSRLTWFNDRPTSRAQGLEAHWHGDEVAKVQPLAAAGTEIEVFQRPANRRLDRRQGYVLFGLRLRRSENPLPQARVWLHFEYSDSRDLFYGRFRGTLAATAHLPLARRWHLLAGGGLGKAWYPHQDVATDRRSDLEAQLSLEGQWWLSANGGLILRATYDGRFSSVDELDYERLRLGGGWQQRF